MGLATLRLLAAAVASGDESTRRLLGLRLGAVPGTPHILFLSCFNGEMRVRPDSPRSWPLCRIMLVAKHAQPLHFAVRLASESQLAGSKLVGGAVPGTPQLINDDGGLMG